MMRTYPNLQGVQAIPAAVTPVPYLHFGNCHLLVEIEMPPDVTFSAVIVVVSVRVCAGLATPIRTIIPIDCTRGRPTPAYVTL